MIKFTKEQWDTVKRIMDSADFTGVVNEGEAPLFDLWGGAILNLMFRDRTGPFRYEIDQTGRVLRAG